MKFNIVKAFIFRQDGALSRIDKFTIKRYWVYKNHQHTLYIAILVKKANFIRHSYTENTIIRTGLHHKLYIFNIFIIHPDWAPRGKSNCLSNKIASTLQFTCIASILKIPKFILYSINGETFQWTG